MRSERATVLRYLLFWPVLAVAAVANGALRELTYGPWVTELAAHQISTLSAGILTACLVALLARRWPLESRRAAWFVGIGWLALTVAFEFGFGRYLAGHSWQRLAADYDLTAGRVWPLFLVWLCILPAISQWWQRRSC